MLDIKLQNKILGVIGNSRFGCSSTDVSKSLKVNRLTAAKYLSSMRAEGLLDFKKIGMAKVWYVEKSPILNLLKSDSVKNNMKDFLSSLDGDIIVIENNFRVIWANNAWEEKYGKHKNRLCYAIHGKRDICPKCPAIKSHKTGRVERTLCDCINKEQRYFESVPIKDNDGAVVASIEISRAVQPIDST